MSAPRQHHILPIFYLSGFTEDGTREGRLHVFDYVRDKQYTSTPAHVGHECDFYRVYEPNTDPYITERSLADLESELAPALKNVLATGVFHGGEELASVLSLVALNYARARRARHRLTFALSASIKGKLAAGVVTKEQWDRLVAAELRAGVPSDQLHSFEEATRLATHEDWSPKAPEVLKVGLITEIQRGICDVLADRTWSLARTDDQAGHFICSDTPLSWSDDYQQTARMDDPNQTITAPLGNYLALITRDDGRRGTYKVPKEVVAWVNFRTQFGSCGNIYWDGGNFPLLRGHKVSCWSEYQAFNREVNRRRIADLGKAK
jgi:hypothetical protein